GGVRARRARRCRAAGQRRAGPAGARARAAGGTPDRRAHEAARMKLRFTKMEGAGNDFVVVDFTQRAFDLKKEQVRKLADRHFGIGADQVLVVERTDKPGVDFRYRIFNADGSEVEQCGNGARCFVKFVHGRGLTKKTEIRVDTLGGVIAPRMEQDGEVSV